MAAELDQMKRHKVWILVDPPADCKLIGNKWVFKAKKNASGKIEKWKARLVARGFS